MTRTLRCGGCGSPTRGARPPRRVAETVPARASQFRPTAAFRCLPWRNPRSWRWVALRRCSSEARLPTTTLLPTSATASCRATLRGAAPSCATGLPEETPSSRQRCWTPCCRRGRCWRLCSRASRGQLYDCCGGLDWSGGGGDGSGGDETSGDESGGGGNPAASATFAALFAEAARVR